jgi:predicted enzyme related to lactoylglutathione lyase
MKTFYLRLLGDALRSRRPGFVSFEWGPMRLTITQHDLVDGRALEPARLMVNLLVDDAVAAERFARGLGAPVVRSTSPEPWGGLICTIEDPDGNYLQFMELP